MRSAPAGAAIVYERPGGHWSFSLRALFVLLTACCALAAVVRFCPLVGLILLCLAAACAILPLFILITNWPVLVIFAAMKVLDRYDSWRVANRLPRPPLA